DHSRFVGIVTHNWTKTFYELLAESTLEITCHIPNRQRPPSYNGGRLARNGQFLPLPNCACRFALCWI
ncbi:hypothetical protein AB4369_27730, partial [Vibrio sp. 10N.261.49.A5]|uniref:hypothetical protein n=1 Tax=Vibrio sp. 10N.261.49.A5 TaxID=3229670 RepID=UPI00355397AE